MCASGTLDSSLALTGADAMVASISGAVATSTSTIRTAARMALRRPEFGNQRHREEGLELVAARDGRLEDACAARCTGAPPRLGHQRHGGRLALHARIEPELHRLGPVVAGGDQREHQHVLAVARATRADHALVPHPGGHVHTGIVVRERHLEAGVIAGPEGLHGHGRPVAQGAIHAERVGAGPLDVQRRLRRRWGSDGGDDGPREESGGNPRDVPERHAPRG
jgi:hypothetical protein